MSEVEVLCGDVLARLPDARVSFRDEPNSAQLLEVIYGGVGVVVEHGDAQGFGIRKALCRGCGLLEDGPSEFVAERVAVVERILALLPSPVVVEAEQLVIAGRLHGALVESQAQACLRLHDAIAAQADSVPIWLDTCARLQARDAAAATLAILVAQPPSPIAWFLAASDAARVVGSGTPLAAQFAECLCAHADGLLIEHPYHAARALLGAIILDSDQGIPALTARLRTWPIGHLMLAARAARRPFKDVSPSERSSMRGAGPLYDVTLTMIAQLRKSDGDPDARFLYKALLELAAVLVPPAQSEAMLPILCDAHQSSDPVVYAGAVYAMCVLLHDHGERIAIATKQITGGPKLLASARRAPPPHGYKPRNA